MARRIWWCVFEDEADGAAFCGKADGVVEEVAGGLAQQEGGLGGGGRGQMGMSRYNGLQEKTGYLKKLLLRRNFAALRFQVACFNLNA